MSKYTLLNFFKLNLHNWETNREYYIEKKVDIEEKYYEKLNEITSKYIEDAEIRAEQIQTDFTNKPWVVIVIHT